MTPEARLARQGFGIPVIPKPVAVYVPAVRSGNHMYTSGQLPLRDGKLLHPGKVGADVTEEQAREAAHQCVLNALAAVRSLTGELVVIRRVVKVVGFVSSAPGFTGQPGVVNAASHLLGEAFDDAGTHARSAVGVAALPLDAAVEIELIVEL